MGYIENLEEDLSELTTKFDSLCEYLGIELVKSRRTVEEMKEFFKKTNNPYQDPNYYKINLLKKDK